VVAGNFATPWALLTLLDASVSTWRAFVLNPQAGWPRHEGLVTETPFVGPGVRDDDSVDYLPMRLSLVPRLFATRRPPQVVLLHTSAPRRRKVSLGIEVNILPAAIERVREHGGIVVAQLNDQMPYTFGDAEIDVEDVDYAIECDGPLPSPPTRHADDGSEAIGERIAAYAVDGATVQLGIGALPDAAAQHLRDVRGLRVWSELLSDGVLDLERAGSLDTDWPLQASFMFGSAALYEWAHLNPRLQLRRTETINDPATIAGRDDMLSINTALSVDLLAQANASHVGGRIYSGFGGQPDFVVGALHSRGGHAIIALRSWHEKSNSSNVVGVLSTPVTSFQHSVIVTEHGAAEIFGRSDRAQTELLTEVADPRARAALRG
jgi:acyl-CoA hydrolase